MNKIYKLLLFGLFISFNSFAVYGQNITVINPNGGELLPGCVDYEISWNESTTSGFFHIDYSIDGGQNWVALEYTNTSQDQWIQKNFLISNSGIELTDQVQFRFIAEDITNLGDSGSGGSIIEAAIDDFTISIFETDPSFSGDLNGDGTLNVLDVIILVNIVLSGDCSEEADLNADTGCNVLDVVLLVNQILG